MVRKATRRPQLCVGLLWTGGAAAVGWGTAGGALAQEAVAQNTGAAPTAESGNTVEEVVVTSTRIERTGYQAPTPTTVIGEREIAAKAPANIADLVNQMPAFAASLTPTNGVSAVSAGLSGINTLNLRDLGPNRTLVLLDGQRVAASTLTGWVDINTFPQALVKRIDVVTGGASAGWGSDAVAGVVNFILDKNFTGLQGEVSGGTTTYGDNGNYKVSLTGGTGFADGHGHVLLSGEVDHSDGITGVPRPWAYNANLLGVNPNYAAGNGQPEYITGFTGFATATPGGIITSGPTKGTYFGPGGTPLQFNYGTVSGNFMQGGNSAYSYNAIAQSGDLAPRMDRQNIFFRTSFDITGHVQIFGQASYGASHSFENALDAPLFSYFTVNPASNAFLPASVAAAGTTPFKLGSFLQDYGPISATTTRNSTRGVIGAIGDFDAAGSNWTWDAYGQTTRNDIYVASYELNVANLLNAVDAVRNPSTGGIQCASVASNPSCVPFDLFGTGVNSPAAIAYVTGTPWGRTQLTEDDMAANLRGNPISDWAGPISVAAGIEHRRESVTGSNDPISSTHGWFAGNELASHGAYNVTEGYFETVVPLAKDVLLAKSLDINGAVRETDYSTFGAVTTWKAGLTYSPIDDISFRATRSRDIRAPNLSELFAAGVTGTSSGIVDTIKNIPTGTVLSVTGGTTNLKPEVADSKGVGVILQPRFVPGFEASVDYYDINISNAIFTAGSQQLINECAEGLAQACAGVTRNSAGVITQVNVFPINLANQISRGLDFEASYHRHLAPAPFLEGTASLRLVATHFLKNHYNNGITPATDNVGTNSDGVAGALLLTLPRWKYQADFGWEQGPAELGLTVRGVSAGVYNTSYIQCTSNCPLATAAHPTIADNHIPGAIYFDGNFSYKLPHGIEAFMVIQNFLNTPPVQTAYGPTIGGAPTPMSPSLYDVLGRTFRLGVRVEM
jgi:outer membrane receptor protein involved in Fe transport